MKSTLKLDNMDFDRIVLAIVSSLSLAGIIGGIKSVISQSSKNSEFHNRISNVENDRDELMKDVKELLISNAKNSVILENMNSHLQSVAESTKRIHQRLDDRSD